MSPTTAKMDARTQRSEVEKIQRAKVVKSRPKKP
jgi:hypothetical protein